eukprot:symbB.v1.2.000780.t1/scaffold42.1/size391715/9
MLKFNPYTEVKHADYSKVFAAWTRRFRNSVKDEEHDGSLKESNGRKRMGTERLRRRDLRELEKLLKDLSVYSADVRRAMVSWTIQTVQDVRTQAQRAFGKKHLRLITAKNQVLADPDRTLEEAEIQDGECLTALVLQPQLVATEGAFALWYHGDCTIVTWGDSRSGGDSSAVEDQLKGVQHIHATWWAFAAILEDGSVVFWGDADYGGDTSVRDQLKGVEQIRATDYAFAAILADGSVIQATRKAFAAILEDGSIVTWGPADYGGDSSGVRDQLKGVLQIRASLNGAFAAILADGSVVTWGSAYFGGDSSAVREQLMGVQQIQASGGAFAAILANGSVVTWGHPDLGGDSSAVWCLDNDEMAIDVSRHLLDSLEEEDITAHERCLRLCLISDILHNASSTYRPGAVVYRREFETHLPGSFEHFHHLFKGVKDLSLVKRILTSWMERAIFTPKFVKGLEASMIKGIVSAQGINLPDSLLVKVAEWQSQHFSQLEKICKVQGMNWDVQLSEKAEAMEGRFPEELRKKWLLDRLLTYELYVLETKMSAVQSNVAPLPKLQMDPFEALDPEVDGESLDSDDEEYVRRIEESQAAFQV